MGLRELKKERTRRLIVDTAWRMFADRGFDRVTVVEVAREAQVAEATVFNYFPTKEDLFFFRLEAFGSQLIDAISARDAGEPVLVAFRRYLLESGGLLAQAEAGDPDAFTQLRTVNRVIAASPALLAREQRAIASQTDALAALLVAEAGRPLAETGAPSVEAGMRRAVAGAPSVETGVPRDEAGVPSVEVSAPFAEADTRLAGAGAPSGEDAVPSVEAGAALDGAGTLLGEVDARVAANALMGVHRALIDHVRRRVLADDELGRLAADVRQVGSQAFALLERGLHDYAVKPHGQPSTPATGVTTWPTPSKEPAS
jgi:AcrR family transcriptional regulator